MKYLCSRFLYVHGYRAENPNDKIVLTIFLFVSAYLDGRLVTNYEEDVGRAMNSDFVMIFPAIKHMITHFLEL